MNYRIIPNQIGGGNIGRVYLIEDTQNKNNKLIAKIFPDHYLDQYNNEKSILEILSSNSPFNNYIIKIKNININLEGIPDDVHYILFDYLHHGNLSKYLLHMELFTPISEDYVKLICFKMLKALKVMHNNDISHNKIDLINIMFDDEFNPIIIHFSEAKRDNYNNFSDDFKGLGKILAKLMTNGRFLNFEFYEKKNCNVITDNTKKKYKDTKFWKVYGKEIPKEFITFFNMLMSEREINIDDLLNHRWLNSMPKSDVEKCNIENNYKKYFFGRHQTLSEIEKREKEEIDVDSIINTSNNNSFNNISLIGSYRSIDNTNKIYQISKLEIKEINNIPEGIVFDCIEISFRFDEIIDISNFIYNYILKLEEIIQNIDVSKINIENDEKYLSFSINVKTNENYNNTIIDDDDEADNNEEKKNSNNINNNNIIYEDENNEDEYLNMKIELLKYSKITEFKEIYYLMFNYIDGEIYDYYHYLKIIKEKAKNLLKNKCFD